MTGIHVYSETYSDILSCFQQIVFGKIIKWNVPDIPSFIPFLPDKL